MNDHVTTHRAEEDARIADILIRLNDRNTPKVTPASGLNCFPACVTVEKVDADERFQTGIFVAVTPMGCRRSDDVKQAGVLP